MLIKLAPPVSRGLVSRTELVATLAQGHYRLVVIRAPALPLARLRARGELIEIDAEQLAAGEHTEAAEAAGAFYDGFSFAASGAATTRAIPNTACAEPR